MMQAEVVFENVRSSIRQSDADAEIKKVSEAAPRSQVTERATT